MRYLSLFSGIEAATAAWHDLGWTPVAVAEVDKAASRFLSKKYPTIPNLGDVTKVDWNAFAESNGPIDLVVFGSPCQSFSVAGKRLGLDDPRGNLALYALSVVNVIRPKWFIFENVPGLLSSGNGRDFGAFLGTVEELGYGWAYRILDAQYIRVESHPWAVPQRRRRVFVVGCLGDWRRAAAVLFERESMSGHPPPRREAGKGTSRGFETGPSGGGFTDLAPTMDARAKDGPIRNQLGVGVITSTGSVPHCLNAGAMGRIDYETETMVAHTLRDEGYDASEDGTGRGTPLIPVMEIQGAATRENPDSGPDGIGVRTDGAAYTMEARQEVQAIAYRTAGDGSVFKEGDVTAPLTTGTDPSANLISFDSNGTQVQTDERGAAPTLRSMNHDASHQNGGGQLAVAFDMRGREGGAMMEGPHDTANIRAASGGSSKSYVATSYAVRRLTPLECTRLQGFPDDYFAAAEPIADGQKYKMLGNSMAVNVMRWIGQRIHMVEDLA